LWTPSRRKTLVGFESWAPDTAAAAIAPYALMTMRMKTLRPCVDEWKGVLFLDGVARVSFIFGSLNTPPSDTGPKLFVMLVNKSLHSTPIKQDHTQAHLTTITPST